MASSSNDLSITLFSLASSLVLHALLNHARPETQLGLSQPSENRNFPEIVKVGVAFRGGGAMTALLDDHGQSQGIVEFGVTSVYQSSRTGARETQSSEITAGETGER